MMLQLPEYLAANSYQDTTTYQTPLFQFAQQTDQDFFQWLQTHPKELDIFYKFQAATIEMFADETTELLRELLHSAAEAVKRSKTRSPNGENTSSEERPVLLVGVGSGRSGRLLNEVCASMPEVLSLGRVIMQDPPKVVGGLEVENGVEPIVHDFFEPQPIIGDLQDSE